MTTSPESMNCPTCGAPVSSDATQCGHCGSRLAVVACPSCFGMVFAGAKFCSHCGAAIAAPGSGRPDATSLPALSSEHGRDRHRPKPISANARVAKASGLMPNPMQHICADREQQSAVLGVARSLPTDETNLERNSVRSMPRLPDADESRGLRPLFARRSGCVPGTRHVVRQG